MASQEITDEELIRRFPDVLIDYDNRAHFAGLLEKRLLINRCDECGFWIYPHRPLCPRCWSESVTPTEIGGHGTIYMFTFSFPGHVGSRVDGLDHAEATPYAAVDWDEQEGLRYLAPVVECAPEDIHTGMHVELTWIERLDATIPAFRPSA